MRIPILMMLGGAIGVLGAELPVRQVILYKHGVGYFERAGTIGPGETARLDFKAAEMNDVLKSLTIEERGGGKVSGLRYDSSIPLAEKLAEYPFRLEAGKPLSAVLDQLRGARVELEFGATKTAGVIVGARQAQTGKDGPEREQVTLLLDGGDLRNFDLAAAQAIRFTDVRLAAQFRDYLMAVSDARSVDRRSLYVDSSDKKAHEVVAGYITPSAVWKSSYRLLFGEKGVLTLEGWAIVDNTTGEDWTNVRMSLVSGKPISFISQLYEPKYVEREAAELAEDAAVKPTVYAGVMNAPAPPPPGAPMEMRAAKAMNGGFSVVADTPRLQTSMSVAGSSAGVRVEGRDLGELFEYRIETPVTVKKNESAMLPFLQQKIDGRKLLIYSDTTTEHPLQAAELTNSTGKTLDGGPITVFEGGAYAGEALVETVKSKDKRLISYAVDLGTRITTRFGSGKAVVREMHVTRGVLEQIVAAEENLKFTIRNVDAKAKTLIVEHETRGDYKLISPKAAETTASAYRFEVALAPDSTKELNVVEERVYTTTTVLTSITPDVLTGYLENRSLSDGGRRALQQIADAKRGIAMLERDARDTQSSIDDLTKEQNRLRQNIQTLNGVSGQQLQVQGYAAKLAAQDGQISTLGDRKADLQKKKTTAEGQLAALIEKMNF